MSTREHIENDAASWLVRREDPDFTPAEEQAFAAWLEAAPAHKLAYWRLEQVWMEADRLKALHQPAVPIRKRSSVRGWRLAPLAALMAAGIAVVVMVGDPQMFGRLIGTSQPIETESGGRRLVSLADGSAVELNTATRVRTHVTSGVREVWLDRGEAYFEVAHDASRPFIVHAGPRTITVLGTRFSVRRDGNRVTVAVREGRVRVDVEGDHKPEVAPVNLLTRGDMIVADGSSTFVAPPSAEKVEKALSWRTGFITFDQTTLSEAAAEFNRYNTKPLVVSPSVAGLRISGAFEARNTGAFGRLMHDGLGLTVTDHGDRVTISE